MITYLGHKVDVIDDKTRLLKNKMQSWNYGYDESIDTVIISKDGTLGEVYNVCGLNIGFPVIPDKKKIINYDKPKQLQKWKREELPKGLNEETWEESRFDDYIEKQVNYRHYGVWVYINGTPMYFPGTYWFFLQWIRIEEDYPLFRVIQNELMIFWEACKADKRSLGMIYVKNRRFGASSLAVAEILESGTIYRDKHLGLISKTGDDAQDIFDRIVTAFKRLPPFFIPQTDGTNTPKKVLALQEPTKKRKQGETVTEGDGLNTTIKWYNTAKNSMDGKRVFRSLIDEAGKYPKDVPFDKYWSVVKTSHLKGRVLFGKAMVVSTVNAMNDGGREYKNVYDNSDLAKRDQNDRTLSGLYKVFIPAKYCLEGYFDQYGYSIVEDPLEPTIADDGEVVKIGAVTYLKNILESLKEKPNEYNEQLRQFPDSERDAFRDEANETGFNIVHLLEQEEHNEFELEDNGNGNNAIERGNFHWKDGIQDTEVIWTPDPINGRFWISHHPPPEYRNRKKLITLHGITAYGPVNEDIGCFGVDPYNRSQTVDKRGSKGSIHLQTKFNTGPFPNNAFILEYIDRAPKVELFFEDVIMAMVYYSIPILPELSNESMLRTLVDRRYRWFIKSNPFKSWKDLSATEKEFGGVPAQDSKIGDQQFAALLAYIQDYIGVARNNDNRPLGEMGFMPFNRTIKQWKEADPNNRTKYDAYISSSLACIGNQRRIKVEIEKPKRKPITIKTYNNKGSISTSA